jgi:uncharacterized protein (TIGR04255 family)
MPLIRPEAPRAMFERSPLSGVICQVQFAPILGINDAAFIASFQEELRVDYPNLGRVGGVDLTVGPGGIEAKEAEQGGWLFSAADGAWAAVLAPNSLSLRAEQYTRYEELRERFLHVLDRCIEYFKPATRTRLGLRYINRLAFDDVTTVGAWRRLVKPELLGIVASADVADDAVISHSLGQTRFAQEESQLLARYGYLPSPVVVTDGVMPESPSGPHFLLDFDHFDVRTFPSLELDAIAEQLDGFHEEIHRLFRWSLTEEGAERLGIVDAEVRVDAASEESR